MFHHIQLSAGPTCRKPLQVNLVVNQFKREFELDPEIIGQINSLLVKEYMSEFKGEMEW